MRIAWRMGREVRIETHDRRSQMFMRKLQLIGAAFAIALVSASATAQKVQMFVGTDYPFSAAYVAAAKGLFAKHGVDATVNTFNTGADAVLAMRSAKAGYVLAGDLPSVRTWAVGDVVGIAPLTWDDSSLAVLAAPQITKAADLKGKRISTPMGSTGEIFFLNYLRQNGIGRKDVDLINLTPGDMPVALARGDIVAFLWNTPTTSAGLKAAKGSHFLTNGSKGFGVNRVMFNAARATAENNPDQVVAVFRALLDAQQFIKSNPDEAHAIVAKALGTTPERVREQIKVFNFDMTLDKAFLDDMTSKIEIAREIGIVNAPINWKTQWMTKFAKAVDPKLVQVEP